MSEKPRLALARIVEMNIGFFSRMRRGLPWVRLKVAQSDRTVLVGTAHLTHQRQLSLGRLGQPDDLAAAADHLRHADERAMDGVLVVERGRHRPDLLFT